MKTKSRIKRTITKSAPRRRASASAGSIPAWTSVASVNSSEPSGTETLALLLACGGLISVLWWYVSLPLLVIGWWLSNQELKKHLAARAMAARAVSIAGMFMFGYIYLGLMVFGLVVTHTPSSLF